MGEWTVGQWIVGVISFQKMYGLYGLKHHKVEMLPCGTDDERRRTREDRATQPLDAGRLSFAILPLICDKSTPRRPFMSIYSAK